MTEVKLTPREPTSEMVSVPRDATNDMLRPFVEAGLEHGEAWMAWQKALDAAPEVKQEPEAVSEIDMYSLEDVNEFLSSGEDITRALARGKLPERSVYAALNYAVKCGAKAKYAPPAEMPKLPNGDIARRFLDACGVEHWEFSHSDAQLRAYAREYAAAQNARLRKALEMFIAEFGDKASSRTVQDALAALKGTP